VALGDPARRDTVALGHLVLHVNAEVAVAEDELVEAERPPDPLVAALLRRIDVVLKLAAIDANGRRRIAARADPLERIAGEFCGVAGWHRRSTSCAGGSMPKFTR
jgi:hypothetical protein